jgi:uncharacterized protein YqfB (UPF0267 family)
MWSFKKKRNSLILESSFKSGDSVKVNGKIGKIISINSISKKYLVLIGSKQENYKLSELSKIVKEKELKLSTINKHLFRKKEPRRKAIL